LRRRQAGSVFRHANGTWAYRYRTAEGRRPQVAGFASKRDAHAELSRILDANLLGQRMTLDTLVETFLDQHEASPATIGRLRWSLGKATAGLGRLYLDELDGLRIRTWRKSLPESQRHRCLAELRQVLGFAVRERLMLSNPASGIENPRPATKEVDPFAPEELEAIVAELPLADSVLVRFLAGTGLRPGEAIALRRGDVDVERRAVTVARSYSKGRLSDTTKTGTRRSVPLRRVVLEALGDLPAFAPNVVAIRRARERIVFPGERGGYLNLANWRRRDWTPALEAAGVDYRSPYALRHTYATDCIAAGLPLFTLARRMGTSLRMIEATYGHLATDAASRELDILDAYDEEQIGRVLDAPSPREKSS
jgi:integrase